jgi:hypothetical protein
MEIDRPSIHLYSDIGYWSYQHVNQMLYRSLAERHLNVEFLQRFFMNPPNRARVLGLLQKRLATARRFSPTAPIAGYHSQNLGKVRDLFNLPSLCRALDVLNEHLVKRQLGAVADMAITFVPSLALKSVFERYPSLIYYCVHDATKQAYHRRNLGYEQELVRKARLVLCDNPVVLSRLAQGQPMLDLSGSEEGVAGFGGRRRGTTKFLLVPPPVPDCFYEHEFVFTTKTFDAIYFGSIHDNIDQQQLKQLTDAGLKVAIVSSQRLDFCSPNLCYFPLQSDFVALAQLIASASAILLPYKNGEFMETVSPAKINQVLVTGLPVFCSNQKLVREFDLIPMDALESRRDRDFLVESYQLDALCRRRLLAYKESTLMARVVEALLDLHDAGCVSRPMLETA